MHIISKKDLSKAEMDTLTKSCSPAIVITANGEVQTHEEPIVYVKELDIFLTTEVLENTPAVLSLGKQCDENGILTNGSMVKNHISSRTEFGLFATQRHFVPIVVPGLTSSSSTSSSSLRTPVKQENYSSSSSSSSPSSPTVGDLSVREREDASNRDISSVIREKPKPTKSQKQIKKKPRLNGVTCVTILRFRNGCKNSKRLSRQFFS